MKIYYTVHNACIPICKECNETIDQHGLIYKGNYWHLNCFDEILEYTTIMLEDIVICTKDRNAKAQRKAKLILDKLI